MKQKRKEAFNEKELIEAAYATAARMHCMGTDLDDAAQEFCLYALEAQRRSDDNRAVRSFQWSYGIGGVKKHITRMVRWHKREATILDVNNEDGKQCHEAVASHTDVAEQLEIEKNQRMLGEALASLQPRKRDVIKMRFFEKATLDQVGERFSISKERVRQIEESALKEMRVLMTR
jgi:RNA polymerase sigma factor (sigma-70 family)